MRYYVLLYYVADDCVSRRAAVQEEHLRLAREANQRGELILAGALSDPIDDQGRSLAQSNIGFIRLRKFLEQPGFTELSRNGNIF